MQQKEVWGIAHKHRGRSYHEQAVQFIKDFPIGVTLTNEQFDAWAFSHGFIEKLPAPDTDKKSDEWLAHLTRRNQLRTNLFKASTHPNMMEAGSVCFVITMMGNGAMIVEAPQTAIEKTEFATKLETLVCTKRRQLGYLMQSVDFTKLPPHQKALAENLYDELSDWNRVVQLQTELFDTRMHKLIRNIALGVKSGEIKPENHAIHALLGNIPNFIAGE